MAINAFDFYAASNLTNNPFRATAMRESDPRMKVWVGYQKEKNTLLKYLERTRIDMVGNTNLLFVYGEYGNGKSHALLWAKNHIQDNQNEYNSDVFYIQTLKKDSGKLTFAGALEYDVVNKSNLLADILEFKQYLSERIVEFKRDNKEYGKSSNEEVLILLLHSYDLSNFALQILKCDNIAHARKIVLPDKITDYQATNIFANIVNLFTYKFKNEHNFISFKNGMYLFIDELDLLKECSAKEQRDVNELIRHLYDLCPNAFCMILSFTASAAIIPVLFAEYVLSRLTAQIVLQPLDPSDAKEFIKDIMDSERVKTDELINYYPFEENAIDVIVANLVTITPRKVINVMQQVLEEVRLLNFLPSRENQISQRLLDENDIIVEIIGVY